MVFPHTARLILAGLLLFSLAACATPAPPVSSSSALPSPQIRFLPTASPQPLLSTPTPFTVISPVPTSRARLARDLYGQRLVTWVEVARIHVYAPVIPVGWSAGEEDQTAWDSPGAQVGWALGSALPGDGSGNVILYGHNNIDSSVFRNLGDLQSGDIVRLITAQRAYSYQVVEIHILPAGKPEDQRAIAADYLKTTRVPRLTLLSCWPPTNNTHRVIVVAYPFSN
jgi:LPXTG-site transpeptidase (sortase) family protein